MTPDGRLLVSTDRGQGDRRGNSSRHPPLPRRRVRPQPRREYPRVRAPDGGLGLLDLASGRCGHCRGLGVRARGLQPRRAYPLDRRGRWERRDPLGRRAGGPDRNPRGPRGRRRQARLQPRRTHPVYGRRRPTDRLGRRRGPPARAPVPDGIAHGACVCAQPRRTRPGRREARRPGGADRRRDVRRTASLEAFPGRAALAIDYSADGRRLAVAGEGGVGVWDAESGEQLGALLRAPRGPR